MTEEVKVKKHKFYDAIPVTEELLTRVADLMLKDLGSREIAKEMNVSHVFICSLYKRQELNLMLRRQVQVAVSRRAGELINALFKQVKEGNVQAIKAGFQIMGALEHEVQSKPGDTNLTVVLPGSAPQPKTFEAEGESLGSDPNP